MSLLFALTVSVRLLSSGSVASDSNSGATLFSFDDRVFPKNMVQNNTKAGVVIRDSGGALEVHFERVDWPNVFFTPPEGTWDWSAFAGIAVDVFNPEAEAVDVCVRVDNTGADGMNHCNTGATAAQPGEWTTLEMRFRTSSPQLFWGMRGLPLRGTLGQGSVIDPARITAFQVFLPRPKQPHRLLIDNIRLFGNLGRSGEMVPLPFVDPFGQYKHADWPGKLKDEADLAQRRSEERKALEAALALPGRDRFGGWTEGPKLESTGWFRTQEINGKWWLVTPEGHLFFSLGVDVVATWEDTFIEKRDAWFEWLPEPESPFAKLLGYQQGAHSMAEPIDGKGRTFSFYRANLLRKYGASWPELWRENAYARLRCWGFNTLGNWSQADVLDHSPMPFVATTGIGGNLRRIEGAGGYWAKMMDVFDTGFEQAVEAAVLPVTTRYANNPLCIGYFVDNELAWEAVEQGTLASPPDQPCRQAFVGVLKEKYGDIQILNDAWGVTAADWDALRVPDRPNATCRKDLDEFVYSFAKKYFETVKASVRKHAPHQLYLGCRFAWRSGMVVRACADVADVVSFNLYYRSIDPKEWTGKDALGKPILIGEFHFGALDRGMFHTGLVPTRDQHQRAACYMEYVRSVADHPAFVGCHWFQYVDEPLTGRWFDGENYNIGFVDVTDTPYPELVEAAKTVHAEIYRRRYHGPASVQSTRK